MYTYYYNEKTTNKTVIIVSDNNNDALIKLAWWQWLTNGVWVSPVDILTYYTFQRLVRGDRTTPPTQIERDLSSVALEW